MMSIPHIPQYVVGYFTKTKKNIKPKNVFRRTPVVLYRHSIKGPNLGQTTCIFFDASDP